MSTAIRPEWPVASETNPARSCNLTKTSRKPASQKSARSVTPHSGRGTASSRGGQAAPAAANPEAAEHPSSTRPDIAPVELDFDDFEDEAAPEAAVDAEAELEDIDEIASDLTGSSSCIDDPVRMYLMQMGEIPLLTRERGNLARPS